MSAGRKIRDARDARACLKAVRSSGVSRAEWAQAHGVDGRSLHAWELNLRGRGSDASPRPRLVELVPASAPRPDTRYVVRVGELAVEVAGDFEEGALVRLVQALRSC